MAQTQQVLMIRPPNGYDNDPVPILVDASAVVALAAEGWIVAPTQPTKETAP